MLISSANARDKAVKEALQKGDILSQETAAGCCQASTTSKTTYKIGTRM